MHPPPTLCAYSKTSFLLFLLNVLCGKTMQLLTCTSLKTVTSFATHPSSASATIKRERRRTEDGDGLRFPGDGERSTFDACPRAKLALLRDDRIQHRRIFLRLHQLVSSASKSGRTSNTVPSRTIASLTLTPYPTLTPAPILTFGPILAVGSTSAVSSMKHGSTISGPLRFAAAATAAAERESARMVGERRRRRRGFVVL